MDAHKTLYILGRQPALGLAELESLYGAEQVTVVGSNAALANTTGTSYSFSRLGGSVRAAKLLTTLPTTNWQDMRDYLLKTIPQHEVYVPEGKLTIGLSVYGVRVHTKDIERTLLEVKKSLKKLGRSVRIVPNKTLELNTAQVLHNNLTSPQGWELLLLVDGQQTHLAQTTHIQDIEGYAARDQARPMRDARVGMLPPKLAQIIVNLAAAKVTTPSNNNVQQTDLKTLVLDPFCGTGVVLQEANLMGYDVYGSDLEPRMVEYSIGNLHWLREKFDVAGEYVRIEQGDATTHTWQKPIGAVACETYLGQPYATAPPRDQLQKNIRYVDTLHRKFLQNIGKQLTQGTRLCIAVPAWHIGTSVLHLPVLDHLQELGYNRVKFIHASKDQLVYHRSNQVVGRELVVLVKE